MHFYKNVAKTKIVYVYVPEKTPEEDPTGQKQRKIALYIDDRKTIWLDLNDVPWAVQFLYVQNMLKGVALVHADSSGPGGSSSPGCKSCSSRASSTRGDGESQFGGDEAASSRCDGESQLQADVVPF